MALALAGTPATTAITASAATHVVNLPGSIAAGDLLVIEYISREDKSFTAPGWTNVNSSFLQLLVSSYRPICQQNALRLASLLFLNNKIH